ncbi:MAG: ABC transporter ATP-binding protein [Bdellovibrionales bacterium]|nr:ABC transporter ATP-binding protein [Bdellovibrionales bacterium]
MIEFRNVSKNFGEQNVLDKLNLVVEEGKITAIMGPSGAGKSVTLKLLMGLLKPDEGQIFVHGSDICALADDELASLRKKFGMLFQDAALFDYMNVFENVSFPLYEHTKLSDEEIEKRVEASLNEVGLENVNQKLPNELSGGMRKRVGLARAIILEPPIVLFDEPTTGLDPIITSQIGDLILETHAKRNNTFLMISHDLALSYRVAHKIAMLYKGQIVEFASPKELKYSTHPFVREYLQAQLNLEGSR